MYNTYLLNVVLLEVRWDKWADIVTVWHNNIESIELVYFLFFMQNS